MLNKGMQALGLEGKGGFGFKHKMKEEDCSPQYFARLQETTVEKK